jgi:hypothetical protein
VRLLGLANLGQLPAAGREGAKEPDAIERQIDEVGRIEAA